MVSREAAAALVLLVLLVLLALLELKNKWRKTLSHPSADSLPGCRCGRWVGFGSI